MFFVSFLQDAAEQGRIQGALYSVSALASALGPYLMRGVYHYTKDGAFMGPGSMFIVGAGAYIIAIYCSYLLPVRLPSFSKFHQVEYGIFVSYMSIFCFFVCFGSDGGKFKKETRCGPCV